MYNTDPAKRWDNVPDDATTALRCYLTEYAVSREVAPVLGIMGDEVYAKSWREAQTICDARRGGIEVVIGTLLAEYEECDECGEKFGVDFEGDAPAFDHAPTCIRRFTIGQPEIPTAF